MTWFVTWS